MDENFVLPYMPYVVYIYVGIYIYMLVYMWYIYIYVGIYICIYVLYVRNMGVDIIFYRRLKNGRLGKQAMEVARLTMKKTATDLKSK